MATVKKLEVTITTSEEELVDVFMPLEYNKEEGLPLGIQKSDIVYRRIGIKSFPGINVKGDKTFAKKYEMMLDTESSAALREKRCLVLDGKGGFIRCPEYNSCSKCKEREKEMFTTFSPILLEPLTQAESEDDKVIDIGDNRVNVAEDTMAFAMLKDLIAYLDTFEGQSYATIFQMLFDQSTTKEINDELGVSWSTAKDAVNRVRKLAQKFVAD